MTRSSGWLPMAPAWTFRWSGGAWRTPGKRPDAGLVQARAGADAASVARLGHATTTQTIATVAFEVAPGADALLEAAIDAFRNKQEPSEGESYAALKHGLPLHFMSIMVFHDPHYDPLLLIEVNFDGSRPAFWAAFCNAIGPDLIGLLRFCSPPKSKADAKRFEALLATGEGLSDVLQAAAVYPTASHQGNRGRSRAQILEDAAIFRQAEDKLSASDAAYRTHTPVEIHRDLRASLLADLPCLNEASPRRISTADKVADVVKLAVFATIALAILALPGTVLALVLPSWFTALLGLAAVAALWAAMPDLNDLVGSVQGKLALVGIIIVGGIVSGLLWIGLVSMVLFALAAVSAVLQQPPPTPQFRPWMLAAFFEIIAGAICAPAVAFAVLFWLRRLERADSTSLGPIQDEKVAHDMATREDQMIDVCQNHMGSVVLVKPGVLRSILLRVGHHALHLALRIVARDGYLRAMRTVHFAHWALLNNGGRLLFMSNYDGTWDSYLDDFVEKAHEGTTLAWTNCVGSPIAEFLIRKGVTKGRQFKNWARASMAPNLFWYSAYPKLTVNQIERNALIADGLRQPLLAPGKAAQWIRYL